MKTFCYVVINSKMFISSVVLNNDDTKAEFNIASAKRSDSGNYEVKLENSEGSDSLPIKIIVLDRPGKCEGPIELTDSTKTTVSLAWKPPKDDGGAEITGIIDFNIFSS